MMNRWIDWEKHNRASMQFLPVSDNTVKPIVSTIGNQSRMSKLVSMGYEEYRPQEGELSLMQMGESHSQSSNEPVLVRDQQSCASQPPFNLDEITEIVVEEIKSPKES